MGHFVQKLTNFTPQWVNFDPMGRDFSVKVDHFLSKMGVVTKSPFPQPLKIFYDYISNGSFFSVFQKFTPEPKGPFVTRHPAPIGS
jgi:hypothetical protein